MPESKIYLQRVLPLYIGQNMIFNNGRIRKLTGIDANQVFLDGNSIGYYFVEAGLLKPVLRRLQSISDEELEEIRPLCNELSPISVIYSFVLNRVSTGMSTGRIIYLTNEFRYMGFDMDGLIDSGLAVDAATLKQKED